MSFHLHQLHPGSAFAQRGALFWISCIGVYGIKVSDRLLPESQHLLLIFVRTSESMPFPAPLLSRLVTHLNAKQCECAQSLFGNV
jgi:hypothetical protein